MFYFGSIFPRDVSTTGHYIDELFYRTLWGTGIAFALVVAILIYFIIRYRQGKNPKAYYTHGTRLPHLLLTLVLALAVFFFIDMDIAHRSSRVWDELKGNSPDTSKSLQVQILAQQFAWNIKYPGPDGLFDTVDDVESLNQLHVPVRQPVVIELQSKDVVHSFFLPNFRLKQDVVPGMKIRVWFEATETGQFEIACAELCGLGHYRMRGVLLVQSKEEFEKWLKEKGEEKTKKVSDDEW